MMMTMPEESQPPKAAGVELDLSADGSTIDRSVQQAWDCFGRIDAVVNNDEVRGFVRSSVELPEEERDIVLATNLRGTWLATKSVCRRMKDAGLAGSVIASPPSLSQAATRRTLLHGIQDWSQLFDQGDGPRAGAFQDQGQLHIPRIVQVRDHCRAHGGGVAEK